MVGVVIFKILLEKKDEKDALQVSQRLGEPNSETWSTGRWSFSDILENFKTTSLGKVDEKMLRKSIKARRMENGLK